MKIEIELAFSIIGIALVFIGSIINTFYCYDKPFACFTYFKYTPSYVFWLWGIGIAFYMASWTSSRLFPENRIFTPKIKN